MDNERPNDDLLIERNYPYHIRDVHISDPFILADPQTKKYYTYVQFADSKRFPQVDRSEPCFYVLESPDLIHWSVPEVCFKKGDFWADSDYWAPEMHIWKGKYYLISSFRAKGSYRRCQCLVGDGPKGPFHPMEGGPVTPEGWQSLDGTLYVDLKGKPWMVFCHEWLQVNDGQICAIPLSDDLSKAIGDPIILFRASDGPWNSKKMSGGGWVTDGPFLYRLKSGVLIMLWSSFVENGGGGYATGVVRSLSGEIFGPWVHEPLPLYAMDGAHSMLFHSFGGELMMSLHCPNRHEAKRILLFEMEESFDSVHIVNEVTGNWYNSVQGIAKGYAYPDRCIEKPHFRKNPMA